MLFIIKDYIFYHNLFLCLSFLPINTT